MRFASYNVHKAIGTDRRYSPERILDVLGEIDADVVALQEADMRFGDRRAAVTHEAIAHHGRYAPLPVATNARSVGWHGNTLLVKHGTHLRAVDRIALPTLEPRGALLAEIEIGGRPIRAVAMHLDLTGLRRSRQARAIIEACALRDPHPTILMGDLNEWSLTRGCMRHFGAAFASAPLGPSFPSRRPIARLDRIMHGAGVRIIDCHVHHSPRASVASDHLPVWADLELDA